MNLLNKLMDRKDLTGSESKEMMELIISGKLTDSQTGALLVALQNKGVSATELSSFVDVLKGLAVMVKPNVGYLIDTCGTGGDGCSTFNISTISAFVLSACGVNVAKHGNRSVSSICGSADVLERLGVNIHLPPELIEKCIEKAGIGFLFAPNYHPAFRRVGNIRKELGVRTIFNMIGPLLNPANVDAQVIGVFDPKLTELYCGALKQLGMKNAMVVHGSGLDEITLCGETKISHLARGNVQSYSINPEDFGLERCTLSEIQTSSFDESVKIFLEVLEGKKSPKRDIVLMNAAAGLVVAGRVNSFENGVKMASEAIDNCSVLKKFEEFRRMTNDPAENN